MKHKKVLVKGVIYGMEHEIELKEKKNIKWLKVLSNLLFTLSMIVIIALIIITAQSKFTGNEPRILGHRIYIVDSGSMSPTINVDSMILVKELKPTEIKVGDVITYYGHNKESRVTHRVTGIENNGESFITQGDANGIADPMPLEGDKIIGKMVFKVPVIGKILRFLNTQLGMGILITLVILWMVVPSISKKIKKQTNM